MSGRLEQVLGGLLVGAILLDIVLTVLYARMGTWLFSGWLARLVWKAFGAASKGVGKRRGMILSFCGQSILVLLILFWAAGLSLGAAMIMHPELGTGVRATNGDTPTDFVAALYAGGTSMALVGANDFTPHTSGTRLLFLFNSLVGMSVLSLTLTYLMQVYTALQRRNVLAMNPLSLRMHRRRRRTDREPRPAWAIQRRLHQHRGARRGDDRSKRRRTTSTRRCSTSASRIPTTRCPGQHWLRSTP